jgi:hypothetical protein
MAMNLKNRDFTGRDYCEEKGIELYFNAMESIVFQV